MSEIIILSGSPSEPSRTDLALQHVKAEVEKRGHSVKYYSVRDFSEQDLFQANYRSQDIIRFAELIEKADGIIIGSPVYKASYTGVLKALIDLLPENVLKNKSVLPIMVGGSKAHLLAIDYALKPLIAVLKGQPLQGVYMIDKEIDKGNEQSPISSPELLERLDSQITEFIDSLKKRTESHN